jgi:hypothetical protein
MKLEDLLRDVPPMTEDDKKAMAEFEQRIDQILDGVPMGTRVKIISEVFVEVMKDSHPDVTEEDFKNMIGELMITTGVTQ